MTPGHEAGPTQRPMLAGLLTGLLASGPAAALMWIFGTVQAIGDAQSVSPPGIAAGYSACRYTTFAACRL